MWRQRALLVFLLLLVHQICATNEQEHACPPSSCGKITNITYPFRLKGDPEVCGVNRYWLACENNVTVLYLYSGKYHVQAINYNNFTIRVVDPGVQQPYCSSIPRYFLSPTNFSAIDEGYPYLALQNRDYSWEHVFQHIVFLNCRHAVIDNEKYVETDPCIKWHSKGYIYAIAGDLIAKDFEVGCEVKLVAPTSWRGLDTNNSSYTQMHRALLYGFELSWINFACGDQCGYFYSDCAFDASIQKLQCPCRNFLGGQLFQLQCAKGTWSRLLTSAEGLFETINGPNPELEREIGAYDSIFIAFGHYILPYLAGKFLFGMTFFIVLLIYKWRKRHLSTYENIENYLEQNNLMPIGYSYKEIKKMARGFKDKLGEGGYGFVFKGKLRSGPSVAIKMLHKSKGNGQDFISEIATIGRIHHQNVVQLIGYCVEGSKRALVYEFMPNGSLDKFIFTKDGNIHLTYDKIYNIAIGVARGIAYLHHGCEMQILHFDIKPHNILLDETFTPKVSDFGLAKLYPIDNSIVTMTAARGTIGYMAPELFYKNIGGISHKADVYSFGMLLMEMASKRKNLNPHADHSSQLYFPFWIYNQLGKETDIEMEGVTEEENKIAKKMIIVSLWCIQLKPSDRPSMNKVVEMLEGDIESLEIPPKPSLYPHETMENDQSIYSSQTMSMDFISSSSYSKEIVTNPLVEDAI
ncbi:hypothetical protein GLYMA_13G033000v4 [Glycine max]|uniref:Protein kinase domain-containing protein n=1 Tax=Glycine max TaxID=3847 RepID=A0A0R0GPQ0_SOYBN|nr:hypothetical protein GYH30_034996 [Glycine max]KRH18018.1 hypothetical protein GLYMA_13G033000v4 [Glycine max]